MYYPHDPGRSGRARPARCHPARVPLSDGSDFFELDFETQTLELLDEHVERLGRAGLRRILALDDRFVDPRTARDVVALDREQLLERVGRAVGFERPHFHLAESLTAELRLATQRLLGHERVRPRRTRVDLVVDEMAQLEHVQVADADA